MFGSWKTTLLGLIAGIPQLLAGAGFGTPGAHFDIKTFLTGLAVIGLGAVAKDSNMSNAPTPMAEAKAVPTK
jgi:hypothetical protein